MKKRSLQETLNVISANIRDTKTVNMEGLIVDADPSKGFSYPYILAYPKSNMRSTLVMGCLNDYEIPMTPGMVDNQNAIDEIFNLFGSNRVKSTASINLSGRTEEDYIYSKQRIAERIARALNDMGMLLTRAGLLQADVPIMMPLIPGYIDDTLENTASEISKNFAGDIDVQVARMVEDARQVIMDRTNISLDSQIISYGHSKSSTFANNFTTLHPEMVKALIVGGCEHTTLPIDEIRLRVKDEIKENEQFDIIDGIPYKNITQDELDRIIKEYNDSKENHQRAIVRNKDGSYSLSMNYPLGIADVEQYINLAIFPNGKEGLKEYLAKIPRLIFVGEREEEIAGHFSYGSGTTLEGTKYSYAEELDGLYQGGRKASDMFEVEKSSMHNRVLEYKQASLILFGRGANERLRNYMDLATKLGLDVQSKIYEGVGHRGIYGIRELAEDTTQSLISVSEGNGIPQLDDKGGVQRINPIFQLLRRTKVCPSGDKTDYETISSKLPSLPKEPDRADYQTEAEYQVAEQQYKADKKKYYEQLETMMGDIDSYIYGNKTITPETNMDRVYDGLTTDEINRVFFKDKNLATAKQEQTATVKHKEGFTISMLDSAIDATEQQTTTGEINTEAGRVKRLSLQRENPMYTTAEINDRVDEIKRGQLEREEDKTIEQDDGRWEF